MDNSGVRPFDFPIRKQRGDSRGLCRILHFGREMQPLALERAHHVLRLVSPRESRTSSSKLNECLERRRRARSYAVPNVKTWQHFPNSQIFHIQSMFSRGSEKVGRRSHSPSSPRQSREFIVQFIMQPFAHSAVIFWWNRWKHWSEFLLSCYRHSALYIYVFFN